MSFRQNNEENIKMATKANILVHINAYSDDKASNSPTLNNIKWHRDMQGIDIKEPNSQSLYLQPSQSSVLFNGVQATSSDNTTAYDFYLKSGTTNTYVFEHNSGTAPAFRVNRAIGIDNTTQIQVTKNAKLAIYTIVAGSFNPLTSSGVVVGDEVRVGVDFEINSQGKYKILALTSNSFTIENEIATAETVTLTNQSLQIYSSSGVQVGAKIELKSGLSPVTLGTYEITDVYPDKLEFYCLDSLPSESNIQTNIEVYNDAKQFIYIESDVKVDVIINGSTFNVQPFQLGVSTKPGILMLSCPIYSASVESSESQAANVFFITAE